MRSGFRYVTTAGIILFVNDDRDVLHLLKLVPIHYGVRA